MVIQYLGIKEIRGPLIILDNVSGAAFDEVVDIELEGGEKRHGRVIRLEGDKAVIQVFEGTNGISLTNTKTTFTGKPMMLPLSGELLGRTMNGAGRPIDGLGDIYSEKSADINGVVINPVAREYPRDYILTGISSIDAMMTLIRGQKLPIFSGSGIPHDRLAVQIATQARLGGDDSGNFAIVFAAMGVKNDVADFFRREFEKSGSMSRVAMFLNLANDPIIERIVTPRCALTAAEYLAYEKGMHVLVIMTDMSAYAEALRELSSSKGEIPARKGYPGYLYSDLASIYERAGMIKGRPGSVTMIPVLTMPGDDITHPIPDLTGYITEGQIVLDRVLAQNGVYPPISVLPSLSRLMKDGIGKGYTREDHAGLSSQLFASYASVQQARALASVIGEEELSDTDKKYMEFGREFEKRFLNQSRFESRTIDETLDLGWQLISILPRSELGRIDSEILEKYLPRTSASQQSEEGAKW